MKKILLSTSVIPLLIGCAAMDADITTTDPTTGVVTRKTTHVNSFFAKTALAGFEAGHETKTTSSLMKVKTSDTQTEIEKLAPLLEAFAAGAVKGAKP